jgi:hypothetical protein
MIAMTGDRRLAASRIAALAIAALPATGLGVGVQIWAAVVEHKSVGLEVLNALPVVAFALAGLIIVAARPANRVGWWMVFGGVCSALGGAPTTAWSPTPDRCRRPVRAPSSGRPSVASGGAP